MWQCGVGTEERDEHKTTQTQTLDGNVIFNADKNKNHNDMTLLALQAGCITLRLP